MTDGAYQERYMLIGNIGLIKKIHEELMINTKKLAKLGMLISVALILSYVESLIPFGFGIPGIKLGLANLAVLLCLYCIGAKEAIIINVMRILLAGFLFGNLYSIIYSLAGGVFSFLIMWLAKRMKTFTINGVSVLGGVCHNLGQILIAAFVVETAGVFYYIPYLLVAGVLTGWLIGFITKLMIPYFERVLNEH